MEFKKEKLHLDTSVLNFFYAEDAPEKMKVTKKFFKEVKKGTFQTFISEIVIREINDASEPKRTKLKDLVDNYKLKILSLTPECIKLADRYVEAKVIPKRFRDDATHIAIAVLNTIDILVSWNLEHMVKVKTIREVNKISEGFGYKEIDIRIPEEVLP